MSMNVSLTPELEKLVNDEIKNGDYKSASEVVREGLRLVRLRRQKLAALRLEIQIGIDDIEQGRYHEYTSIDELFEDIEDAATRRSPRKSKARQ
jgi:antitoxin ParD1/3/4